MEQDNLKKLEEDLKDLTAAPAPVAPPPPPVQPPPSPPVLEVKKASPLVTIAITSIVIAVIAVAAYLIGTKFLSRKVVPTPTPVVTLAPTATPDPTADWETYTNNYWGISIKYPQDKITPCRNYTTDAEGIRFFNFGFGCPDGTDIVYKIGVVGYAQGKYKEYKKPSSVEKIVIDGKSATKNTYVYEEADGPLFGQKQSQEVVIVLDNGTVTLQQWGINPDDKQIFNQILSTFKFLGQSGTLNQCSSVNLGLSLNLPNQNWKCVVDNLAKEQKGLDGTINLNSSTVTIVITSLGRGPYCSTSQDASCKTVNFYSNGTINLDLYKLDNKNKEIFGMITNGPSISIKWNGMESRDLTSAEKQEIISVLNSITKQ